MPIVGTEQTGIARLLRRVDTGLAATLVVFAIGSYAALSVDVGRTAYGLKGDEATYVAMALSMAHDRDLVYEPRDIERFYHVYHRGPEGIHLKRGGDGRDDRLYFGKAFAYSVAAAPYVWLLGLNGMWVFHLTLFAGMLFLGYRFLLVRSSEWLALTYTLGFFGATIVPLYAVYMTSDLFHTALVFYAYFLWFYKEVAPRNDGFLGGRLHGRWTDIAAAVLLGIAIFSKPTNVLLLAPPVLLAWSRGRVRAGFEMGVVCGSVGLVGLLMTAFAMGELDSDLRLMELLFVFQGGDRKIFFGTFPFEQPTATFDALGIGMTTNEFVVEESLGLVGFLKLLGQNLVYFVFGRHFGFLPYFFPGLVALALFLRRNTEWTVWRWVIVGTAIAGALFLTIYMPYTWSGGGGPAGNRYYLGYYPAFFFLTPTLVGGVAAAVAWLGGALFTAHILMNPFISADQPFLAVERGMLRALPVELTMVNDLPANLTRPPRARLPFGDPPVLLYFLDRNGHTPEPPGIWVNAGQRTEIVVRSGPPILDFTLTLESPVPNTVWASMGGRTHAAELEAGVKAQVTLVPEGVYSRRGWSYLLSLEAKEGFVPRLLYPDSTDPRYLGVSVNITSTLGDDSGQTLHGW